MKALIAALAAALVVVPAAVAKAAHGFRDAKAPQEAASLLNSLPNVDSMRCHWKLKGRTIGCVGLVTGETAELYLWTNGRHVFYHACTGGSCLAAKQAKHVFGHPY